MKGYIEAKCYEELLGMFLREPELFAEYGHDLDDHFSELNWLYKTMRTLDGKGLLTMRNVSEHHPMQLETIQYLYSSVGSTKLVAEKVAEVKRYRFARSLDYTLRSAMLDLTEENVDERYRELVTKLDTFTSTGTSQLLSQSKMVDDWLKSVEEIKADPSKAYGLLTGLQELDLLTTGFHRHDLSIVGARTSMGKSAFMLEMVLRLTRKGYKTAVFSLEMTRKQILNRLASNITKTPLRNIKHGEIDDYALNMMRMHKDTLSSVYIDDARGVSSDYIGDTMRMLKRKHGLDFVVVDYLQDVKEKGEENDNQGSALARICRKLRKAALDCDCHVMALSQVRRDVEYRNDKRPGNGDLSGSTGIETSADMIMLLYRDEYYHPDTEKADMIEVNITKQRNGGLGRVELRYDKACQRMSGRYERE